MVTAYLDNSATTRVSKEAAEKALELSPEDERIKRNLELMRKNTVDNAGKV